MFWINKPENLTCAKPTKHSIIKWLQLMLVSFKIITTVHKQEHKILKIHQFNKNLQQINMSKSKYNFVTQEYTNIGRPKLVDR
jgi:hypothetical protein